MKAAFVLLLLRTCSCGSYRAGLKVEAPSGSGRRHNCLIAAYGAWFFAVLVPSWGLGINMWAINGTYQEYGYVLSTAVSLRYVVKKRLRGYSNARLKEIYSRLEENIYAEAGNGQAYPEKRGPKPGEPGEPGEPRWRTGSL